MAACLTASHCCKYPMDYGELRGSPCPVACRANTLGRPYPIVGRGPAAAALAAKAVAPFEGAARILAAAALQSPGGD